LVSIIWKKEQNNLLTVSALNLWLDASQEASRIGEEIRKGEYGEALKRISETFRKICLFVAKCQNEKRDSPLKLNKSLSEILWWRYPRLCYVCYNYPCKCLSEKKWLEVREKKEAEQEILKNARKTQHPNTIDEWDDMFKYLYDRNISVLSLEEIGFHFLEEIGEVAGALSSLLQKGIDRGELNKRKISLMEELSDAVSWLFGLVHKLANIDKSFDPERQVIKFATVLSKHMHDP
jgi:NTP pyrophosphatase (non-canonical NTP hydrolase)